MKNIAIIDYCLGNLFSVEQACKYLGANAFITSDKERILTADAAILPGVGAFADAMDQMQKLDLVEPLKDFISSNKPFMGVCLGLQLLFTESEEFGNSKGLNIIHGEIKKFSRLLPDNPKAKVPQIAWNHIYPKQQSWENTPLQSLSPGAYQYFVHSYYAIPENVTNILAVTQYEGFEYCSSIHMNNIFACQFHPEKSAEQGLSIYKNWINTI